MRQKRQRTYVHTPLSYLIHELLDKDTTITDNELEMAEIIERLKDYLSEPRHRIRMSDLIDEVIDEVVTTISGEAFDVNNPQPNTETITARVNSYQEACSTLLPMAVIGGTWAEEHHFEIWQQALERLATVHHDSGLTIWLGLQYYPATLTLYALGLGALSANKLEFLGRVFSTEFPLPRPHRETKVLIQTLPPFIMFGEGFNSQGAMRLLEGMEGKHTPLNDWVHQLLRPHLPRISDEKYALTFDKLEVLIALSYAYHQDPRYFYWAPLGSYIYRTPIRENIIGDMEKSISTLEEESPYVKSGIFGKTSEECTSSIEQFKTFVDEAARSMRIFW